MAGLSRQRSETNSGKHRGNLSHCDYVHFACGLNDAHCVCDYVNCACGLNNCHQTNIHDAEDSVRKVDRNVHRAKSRYRVNSQCDGQRGFTHDLSSIRYELEGRQEGNLQSGCDGQKQNWKEVIKKSDPYCS